MGKWMLLLVVILVSTHHLYGQYPPPAGQPGSTAIYKDSSAFRAWANFCIVYPGYINFLDTNATHQGSNKASYGFPADATGIPDNFTVSLGDRGVAILTLPFPIFDSTGPDFAIFENAWSDDFLELAFVEVSSNGVDFIRFPSVSLTPETPQVSTFGTIDATQIHNLAGKYRLFYGTPFDLSDLKDSSLVDISSITHIRIIDVGGCITQGYTSFDSQGHVINDPWPTPFWSCGFDLDAVGIIHARPLGVPVSGQKASIFLYPNPVSSLLRIKYLENYSVLLSIQDPAGNILIKDQPVNNQCELDVSDFPSGLYIAVFTFQDGTKNIQKFIKQ